VVVCQLLPVSLEIVTVGAAVPAAPYVPLDNNAFWIKLAEPVPQDIVVNYLILNR
jgi:hypothetical protein